MVLQLDPRDIAPDGGRVRGVVMDTGLPDGGWYCLVALADGTTSLYTSAAFGVIGAGAHESVRSASEALLRTAATYVDQCTPSADDALPGPGQVVIRLLAVDGRVALTAAEEDLGDGRHPASPLFHAVHDVITQVRLVAS